MSDNEDISKSRFGSFLFGENGMFAEFSDNQRLERLRECASLEKSLRQCQEIYHKANEIETEKNTSSQKPWPWRPRIVKEAETEEMNKSINDGNDSKDSSHSCNDEMQQKDLSIKDHRNIHSLNMEKSTSKVGIKIARFYNWHEGDDNDVKSTTGDSHNPANTNHCIKETHAVWACRALALGCASDLVLLKECFEQQKQNNTVESVNNATDNNDNTCQRAQTRLSTCVNIQASALDQRIKQRRSTS